MTEQEELIVLTDDTGKEFHFHVIDVIEVDEIEYAILLPADAENDEAEVLRIEKDESGEEILVQIEDDEEWERVAEIWEEMIAEEEIDDYDDFEDEDEDEDEE
jgi:uncharacterized protein YrzB (UPF0473 family)